MKLEINILVAAFLLLFEFNAVSQLLALKSGPMLGPVTLTDATIWVQTNTKAEVRLFYRKKGEKSVFVPSEPGFTDFAHGYCATFHIGNLSPGTTYEYYVIANKIKATPKYPLEFTTQMLYQYRTAPPDFSFIAGSCLYINDTPFDRPGKPYGGEYGILENMTRVKPDFMVWLGDNIYLREGDFESRSGIYYRNTHTRSLPELQPFLAAVPHYAIWDDHDYGPNDSDWTFPLKQHTLAAFKDFWPSESYGAGQTEGVTNSFVWNDCQFLMLDNRWYRTVDKENGTILGEQQKYWLKESLLSSNARFKFICIGGQFLNDFVGFENFSNYKSEREEIIQFIEDNNIRGVVFLTGDRHHSEISKLETKNGSFIYDITSSALTSATYDHTSEKNTLRVPGSMVTERNFAFIKVFGAENKRKISISFINSKGDVLYSIELK
jgi:alkaline phosphatase D